MFWDPFNPRRRRPINPYEAARQRALEEEARRRVQAEAQRRQMIEEEEARRRAHAEALRQQQANAASRQAPPPPPEPPTPAPVERTPPAAQPPLPQTVIAEFERELAQARRARDEAEDRHRQLQLETQTMRERLQRNAEERALESYRATLRRFLDVADNLERALTAAESENSALKEGVQLTYREFQRALADAGVTTIETVGQPFDPARHEAVAAVPSPESPSETVLQEIQRGYMFQDKLLRPAKVIVAQ